MNVLILGIGNSILRDEGVGVHVVNAMRKMPLPPGVELVEGGTMGPELVEVIAHRDKVIVVDTVDMQGKPGTVYRFAGQDLIHAEEAVISMHQLGLMDTLTMARHLKCEPKEVIVYGVQPAAVEIGLELTPDVAAVIPKLIDALLAEARGEPVPAEEKRS